MFYGAGKSLRHFCRKDKLLFMRLTHLYVGRGYDRAVTVTISVL